MPPQVRPPKVYKLKMNSPTIRRRFTVQQKTNIVKLYEDHKLTISQIAKAYRLCYQTVQLIYRTYKANGDQLINNMHKAGCKKREITKQAIELVQKPAIL